jgi:hypothetical protein
MTIPERRATPRYRVKPGTFAYFYALGSQLSGVIRDLSLGGVYIEDSRNQFSEGTELDLELRVDDESISVRGVVTRAYPRQGFAVRFLEFSADLKERLERYLRDLVNSPQPEGGK